MSKGTNINKGVRNMRTISILVILGLITIACEDTIVGATPIPEGTSGNSLVIYSDLPQDSNGYYHFDYPGGNNTYDNVYFQTDGELNRVFWYSDDTFTIYHQGFPITEPIIQHSTYSDENGQGQQMFYIHHTAVGDTLDIWGSFSNGTSAYMGVIID